jgi:peroxiredoxin
MGGIMSDNPDLAIGSTASEFNLTASDGTEITLTNYRNKSNVYLFFVREFI